MRKITEQTPEFRQWLDEQKKRYHYPDRERFRKAIAARYPNLSENGLSYLVTRRLEDLPCADCTGDCPKKVGRYWRIARVIVSAEGLPHIFYTPCRRSEHYYLPQWSDADERYFAALEKARYNVVTEAEKME